VSGPIDLYTDARFLEEVRAATAPVVILDLSGVLYCGSRGVAALVQVATAMKRENRRLALVGVHERVRKVLDITRVRFLFTEFATVAEAEQALI
jgi:anti-anti-sigma factor